MNASFNKVKTKKIEENKVKATQKSPLSEPSEAGKDAHLQASQDSISVIKSELTQPSQAGTTHDTQRSPFKNSITAIGPGHKRARPVENIASKETYGTPRFGEMCPKCAVTRSSLKLEIAQLKKRNSILKEQALTAKSDKEQLQKTITFLQKLYTNSESERKELEKKYTSNLAKLANIKKIFN